jgi:hypothetical protein
LPLALDTFSILQTVVLQTILYNCTRVVTLGLADRMVVWTYSDTDAYTLETCDWYSIDSFEHLHFLASQFIGEHLDSFCTQFSEWFNCAEFPDVEQQLQASEVAVFLNAAGAPNTAAFSSIENYDCFSGLCAVIRQRVVQRSLEQIKLAVELFNWTIDFGLSRCDTKARAVIRVGSAADVAPFLLERILDRLPSHRKHGHSRCHGLPNVQQRFLPLAPLLTMLKETVESTDWIQNQLALRIFFWVAEMYKAEIENESV